MGVLERPAAALVATLGLFAVGGLGLVAYKENYSTTGVFKKRTDSVDGFKAIQKARNNSEAKAKHKKRAHHHKAPAKKHSESLLMDRRLAAVRG